MKLGLQHKHIIHLIGRDRGPDGWAVVSATLWPILHKAMPLELVMMEKTETGGKAKLTDEGESVLRAMTWI